MTKKKVMIIEDDEGITDVLRTVIEMYGYEVVVAGDNSIIEDVQNSLPDLLLMDVWMKECDGRKTCRHLKNQADTKHIPIIMVSATRDLIKSARDSGADDFLEKPFEIEDLVGKIQKLI
ncbi:response regulator [Candidatus Daviesbacteria bacterium]|nr:response regulator [Candidatus Daviesbacteria bacterium]